MKAVRRALFRLADAVLGIPLLALFVWPVRWRRRIAGPRGRGPGFLRALASILFLVLFYVAVLETTARVIAVARGRNAGPPWRYVDDRYLYEFHPFRAFGLRSNVAVEWGTAGFYTDHEYHVNELGCRGPALAPRGAGRARVVCFGGSVTFGVHVDDGDTWPARLQRLAPEWSVMNCGVGGYMSPHILALAQDSILDLEPDLAIVYTGRNDIHANEVLYPDRYRDDYQHVHGPRDEPEGLRRWLIRNSWCVCILERWRRGISNAYGRSMQRRFAIEGVGPRGVRAFRRNIEDLLTICRRRGVKVLLASEAPGYLPLVLADGSRNPHREKLRKMAPGFSPEVYTQALETYADALKATGAPYVDTIRDLERHPSLYVDSIHLSPKGSQALAEILLPHARRLMQR